MSSRLRRFEILLPLKFNDGTPVPAELVGDVYVEIRNRFGACSWETQTIRGSWVHEGQAYFDDLVRVFADVGDVPENIQFFAELKERLKARFQQLDIWVTTHVIDVL
jgi:hypothetical protein